MEKLGLSPEGDLGLLVSQCGFEPWERDDGLHPDQSADPDLAYNCFLHEQGYKGSEKYSKTDCNGHGLEELSLKASLEKYREQPDESCEGGKKDRAEAGHPG